MTFSLFMVGMVLGVAVLGCLMVALVLDQIIKWAQGSVPRGTLCPLCEPTRAIALPASGVVSRSRCWRSRCG